MLLSAWAVELEQEQWTPAVAWTATCGLRVRFHNPKTVTLHHLHIYIYIDIYIVTFVSKEILVSLHLQTGSHRIDVKSSSQTSQCNGKSQKSDQRAIILCPRFPRKTIPKVLQKKPRMVNPWKKTLLRFLRAPKKLAHHPNRCP